MIAEHLVDQLQTVRDWLRFGVSHFNEAKLAFGHGCDNAYDEAACLILHALHLPPDRLEPFLDAHLLRAERLAVRDILDNRIVKRVPAAYLTHEAWLAGHRFFVDERVIVPRSFFGEALAEGLAPWIADADAIGDALDLGTGSGCLAILMALAFPRALVDAVDISPAALTVARQNVSDYELTSRVWLHEGDLFGAVAGRTYDLIISNPPYVTDSAMAALPPEYRHEPSLALAAGPDGLDVVRRILAGARHHLKPHGLLAVEIGHHREIVEKAFPQLPFVWLDRGAAAGRVFILDQEQLPRNSQ